MCESRPLSGHIDCCQGIQWSLMAIKTQKVTAIYQLQPETPIHVGISGSADEKERDKICSKLVDNTVEYQMK